LIKGIQKLIPNIKGEVFINGEKINELSPKQIAQKVAYVPQLSDFIFQFTVKELIEMARYVYQGKIFKFTKWDLKKVEEAMEIAQVKDFQARKIAQLSGGERKRVLIARALAQDTPLIFLDEPSAHLDLNFQIEIYKLLFHLCKEKGKTIICAEHNINLVIPFCDRIIFLNNGGIFKEGKPSEIINEENIKEVYNACIKVRKNPNTGLPEISLI
jgi:iron complex transport system ATP-binding protein